MLIWTNGARLGELASRTSPTKKLQEKTDGVTVPSSSDIPADSLPARATSTKEIARDKDFGGNGQNLSKRNSFSGWDYPNLWIIPFIQYKLQSTRVNLWESTDWYDFWPMTWFNQMINTATNFLVPIRCWVGPTVREIRITKCFLAALWETHSWIEWWVGAPPGNHRFPFDFPFRNFSAENGKWKTEFRGKRKALPIPDWDFKNLIL